MYRQGRPFLFGSGLRSGLAVQAAEDRRSGSLGPQRVQLLWVRHLRPLASRSQPSSAMPTLPNEDRPAQFVMQCLWGLRGAPDCCVLTLAAGTAGGQEAWSRRLCAHLSVEPRSLRDLEPV